VEWGGVGARRAYTVSRAQLSLSREHLSGSE